MWLSCPAGRQPGGSGPKRLCANCAHRLGSYAPCSFGGVLQALRSRRLARHHCRWLSWLECPLRADRFHYRLLGVPTRPRPGTWSPGTSGRKERRSGHSLKIGTTVLGELMVARDCATSRGWLEARGAPDQAKRKSVTSPAMPVFVLCHWTGVPASLLKQYVSTNGIPGSAPVPPVPIAAL